MDAQLEGVWDASRRAEVEAAIEHTGLSYAMQTSSLVESGLDDYTERWVEARMRLQAVLQNSPFDDAQPS